MGCDRTRQAISALLDAEDPGVAVPEIEEHLFGCARCQRWKEAAHTVTRAARIEAARVPDAGASEVVTAVLATTRPSRWPTRLTLARLGLIVVAVAQLAIAVPVLVFGEEHSAPVHVAHEMGSFDLALAIGFLAVAWRPERARGMRPLVGAIAFLLMITALSDLIGGRTSLGDEAPHLLTVIAWLLLVCVASEMPPSWGKPSWVSERRERHRAHKVSQGTGNCELTGDDYLLISSAEVPPRRREASC
jgi:predicted anti-sigma-YlaC factor YlaD